MKHIQSRSSRFLWAAGFGWGNQFLVLFVGLWLTKYLLERLGSTTMGWWSYALVMVGYITTIDLGLSALLPRDVARETGISGSWEQAHKLPIVLGKWAKFALLQVPAAALIAIVSISIMARNEESDSVSAAIVMGIALMLYPFRIGGLVVNGLQDFRFEGVVQITSYVAGVTVTILASRFLSGPAVVICGWATQLGIAYTLMWSRLLLKYRRVLPSFSQIQMAATPFSMVGTGIWAWISSLGVTMMGTAEVLAIGSSAKGAELFNYTSTTKLVSVLIPLAFTIGASMIPGLTELRSIGNMDAMERASKVYGQMVLAISGLFGCVVIAINPMFLEWWIGRDHYIGEFVTVAAVIGMNLKHFLNVLGVTMFSLNLERPLWAITFASGITAIVLTLVFVKFGGTRAAVAGPVTALMIAIPIALLVVYTKAPSLALKHVRTLLVWAPCYGIAFLFCNLVVRKAAGPNLLSLMAVGTLAVLCYLVVLLLPAIRSEAWERIQRYLMISKITEKP